MLLENNFSRIACHATKVDIFRTLKLHGSSTLWFPWQLCKWLWISPTFTTQLDTSFKSAVLQTRLFKTDTRFMNSVHWKKNDITRFLSSSPQTGWQHHISCFTFSSHDYYYYYHYYSYRWTHACERRRYEPSICTGTMHSTMGGTWMTGWLAVLRVKWRGQQSNYGTTKDRHRAEAREREGKGRTDGKETYLGWGVQPGTCWSLHHCMGVN